MSLIERKSRPANRAATSRLGGFDDTQTIPATADNEYVVDTTGLRITVESACGGGVDD
jgi:hypothetical protein